MSPLSPSIGRDDAAEPSAAKNLEPAAADDAGEIDEGRDAYVVGGFHPVYIGETYADGAYEVLRKLGYGRYSTVWLVRNLRYSSILPSHSSSAFCRFLGKGL
jgi:serine/threonine-protein kinase SRPK3